MRKSLLVTIKKRFSLLVIGTLILSLFPGYVNSKSNDDVVSKQVLNEDGQQTTEMIDPDPLSDTKHNLQVADEKDTDGDGLTDSQETLLGTDLSSEDSDSDGLTDYIEVREYGTSPIESDSDNDGLMDAEEISLETNPFQSDSDGDMLSDYDEVHKFETDPTQSDTDHDKLSDGTEVLFYDTNPNESDEDSDGKLDGEVNRTYTLPENEWGVEGTATGTGDLPMKIVIRETPILLLQQLEAPVSFELLSLDETAHYSISIPLDNDNIDAKGEPILFKYLDGKGQLIPVENQKLNNKQKTLEAEFTGGGSFVVLPKKEWDNVTLTNKHIFKDKYKGQKFKGKAKLIGLPGFEITSEDLNSDGVLVLKKKMKGVKSKSLDNSETETITGTREARYLIDELYESDETTFLTVKAISAESGYQETILIHGWNGDSTTWGLYQDWDNDGRQAEAEQDIAMNNFTKSYYLEGDTEPYSNIDVQFISRINTYTDSGELGAWLVWSAGYTPNKDLFIFEYENDYSVRIAAGHLEDVIEELKDHNIIDGDVNLLAHSMGGLVARYYVENLDGYYNVDRLITLGTPHFGSDLAFWNSDLNRLLSELWNEDVNDGRYMLNGNRGEIAEDWTEYFGIAGVDLGFQAHEEGLEGLYFTGTGVPEDWESWDYYVRYKFQDDYPLSRVDYPVISDNVVPIDSALGSDQDWFDPLPSVLMHKRYIIFHNKYGGHSEMRKYSELRDLIVEILQGDDDGGSPD
ncbi:lipase family alpha/beta hydrolase [Brevibacillus marinus]|uniref:lipase family alpha/beta hydrolase n=1 Tax=Brevibacillus marinus TaxID=2496837 RepID=UPI000F8261A8|nr:hypothetical protein [Brevibacillus marinus]